MDYSFFDANTAVGLPAKRAYRPAATAAELLSELDAAGIDRALIWHIAQQDCSPQDGNRLVHRFTDASERFTGCWTLLPPQTGEVIDGDFFGRMKAAGIAALRVFPALHRFQLNRVVFGTFLDEVCERRIPLLLSLERGVTWPAVHALLNDYPTLTCVLCDVGVWGQNRNVWPLLERFERVCVETSLVSLAAAGVEATAARYGAARLVFGTGFPVRYPQAAVLDLLSAELSETDRRDIAAGNLERLLTEAEL